MREQKSGAVVETDRFVLVGKSSAPEVLAEGVSQVLMGYPMSRLVLHTVLDPEDAESREIRRAAGIVTMSTVSLVQTAKLILKLAKEAEGQLSEFNAEHGVRIRELLKDINVQDPAGA